MVATIYSCWEEALKEKAIINETVITDRVYKFHKEKAKFEKDDIVECFTWMIENKFAPAG